MCTFDKFGVHPSRSLGGNERVGCIYDTNDEKGQRISNATLTLGVKETLMSVRLSSDLRLNAASLLTPP